MVELIACMVELLDCICMVNSNTDYSYHYPGVNLLGRQLQLLKLLIIYEFVKLTFVKVHKGMHQVGIIRWRQFLK